MTREQRFKYEMFVRVSDYGTAHTDLFPASSRGGRTFEQVTAAVAAIDEHLKTQIIAGSDARKVKAATRAAVFGQMKTLALAARRVTRPDRGANPFRMPRRRSLKVEVSTARVFAQEAEKRWDEFAGFGLPPTFIGDFRGRVDDLQQAMNVRLSSNTARRLAQVSIQTTLAQGLDAIRDLDVIVAVATEQDPALFAAWQRARHITGQGSAPPTAGKAPVPAPAPVPPIDVTKPGVVVPAPTVAPAGESEAPDPGLALARAS